MNELAILLTLTCTVAEGDVVDGWQLYWSNEPVTEVADANWFNFNINECRFQLYPNNAVGRCWYITSVGRGPDDPVGTIEQSGLTNPVCFKIVFDEEKMDVNP